MGKAFVDTTILTDALLKPNGMGAAAKLALARYDITELPVYALKEFKAGPLKHFVWFHNKLVLTKSYALSLEVLQRMSLTPKRYTVSTVLEALTGVARKNKNLTSADLLERYGPQANLDSILCDQFRLAIRVMVEKAWKRRRKVTTSVVNEIECYKEVGPIEENGLLNVNPTQCLLDRECCLAGIMKGRPEELRRLVKAIDGEPITPENRRRRKVLKEMIRIPKHYKVSDKDCRNLGDAIFAFFAPKDSVILTTNIRDHEPLAAALGKSVERP